jgi:IMP dehydrogenase
MAALKLQAAAARRVGWTDRSTPRREKLCAGVEWSKAATKPREDPMKTVGQILDVKGSSVLTVTSDISVFQALELMASHEVGALVVVEGETICGLLSERDYARKVVLRGRRSLDTPVREIMTPEVICVGPKQTADACMALMTEKRLRHLPVLEEERLVGIVSIGDVVKAIIDEQQFTIEQLHHYITGRRT